MAMPSRSVVNGNPPPLVPEDQHQRGVVVMVMVMVMVSILPTGFPKDFRRTKPEFLLFSHLCT
jgi:hypothetical protein